MLLISTLQILAECAWEGMSASDGQAFLAAHASHHVQHFRLSLLSVIIPVWRSYNVYPSVWCKSDASAQ